MAEDVDAIVIGSGPNGLAAGITIARAGFRVLVLEGSTTPGGGMRSRDDLTLPGFVHDLCSAIHPMAVSSPFFNDVPLKEFGLSWAHPEVVVAHPLDGGRAGYQLQDYEAALDVFGRDADGWRSVVGLAARRTEELFADLLGPLPLLPHHPILLARFGVKALMPAAWLAEHFFGTPEVRALFGGHAAHSVLPLERWGTAAVGPMLAASGHHAGWPVASGGSGAIAAAMVGYLEALGGTVECGRAVESLEALPPAKAYLFDTSPMAMAGICGNRLPHRYVRRLERYRYGPGVFKLDLALDGPVPWRHPACRRAGTVHVCGTLDEIRVSEHSCWHGRLAERPFVIVAQQSVADPNRAPSGKHTLWAYCHVPPRWDGDATEAILAQVERFAPGFRDLILAIHKTTPADLEAHNPNYIGGDIIGGVQDLAQQFARPVARRDPYSTPAKDIYLCSSSTPPGAGVHGMCGYHAAASVLRNVFGLGV
ncbi:NAD(P)/FAD-dependent oxidoreductase [soil metagenome]